MGNVPVVVRTGLNSAAAARGRARTPPVPLSRTPPVLLSRTPRSLCPGHPQVLPSPSLSAAVPFLLSLLVPVNSFLSSPFPFVSPPGDLGGAEMGTPAQSY